MPIDVHLVAPDREVWSGAADMVIARGVAGEVGILRGHAPLLIRLAIGPLRILREEGELRAVVDGGFLHVTSEGGETRVDVLASNVALQSEIDVEAARRRLDEAEHRVRETDEAGAREEVAKAAARIELAG